MPVTSEQFQSTPLSRPVVTSATAAGPVEAVQRDPNKVGVVLVHGIGSQKPAETFLDWSRPLVELLADWRVDHGFAVDPVQVSQFSFSGSSLPYLEIDVPALTISSREFEAETWVITEAWWAAQVRAPTVGAVTAYLRDGLGRILDGIRRGYDQREAAWQERLDQEAELRSVAGPQPPGDLEGTPDEVTFQAAEIARILASPERWRWIAALDWVQKWLTILALGPALVVGTLLLLFYTPFRAIPIQRVRDLAVLKQADNFLTDWFGDLPTLLDDAVQSANVRSRTAEAIDRLKEQGCRRIVLVAHSGGAIVSFTTLVDPEYVDREVNKLITIGEGLGLAWHLEQRDRLLLPGSRLASDLRSVRPHLLWYNFWASYDPAPGGPLVHPLGLPLPVTSRPVTNRMSILEDHGGYWDNDEGFLIPLLRHLDTAGSRPEDASPGSRFYPDSGLRTVLIERRRQRVAVLALWRWIAVIGALVPIVLGTVLGRAGAGPAAVGRSATSFWGHVPGHELVTGPIDWLAGLAGWPACLRDGGEWAFGTLLVALLFAALAVAGIAAWNTWDRRERRLSHSKVLARLDRRDVAVDAAVLLAIAVALSGVVVRGLLG